MRPTRLAASLLLLFTLACDRRTSTWVPLEQEPPPPAKPVRIPGLEMAQAQAPMPGSGGRDDARSEPAAGASSAAPAQGGAEAASGDALRGTLRLAGGTTLPSQGVLFLIARTGPPPQPPLAVKRLPSGPFPLEFSIGPEDVMIPGRKFTGPITLTARFDLDGNPMSRAAGDLQGAAADAVQPGAGGIEIVLGSGS